MFMTLFGVHLLGQIEFGADQPQRDHLFFSANSCGASRGSNVLCLLPVVCLRPGNSVELGVAVLSDCLDGTGVCSGRFRFDLALGPAPRFAAESVTPPLSGTKADSTATMTIAAAIVIGIKTNADQS